MFFLTRMSSINGNVLFITLDSCRYDTFKSSHRPNISRVGPLHKAFSPSYFTYGSHASMWMGFTPGVRRNEPLLNPKAGKLFRMSNAGFPGISDDTFKLQGSNIIQGFSSLGYTTIGTGSVGWFDPNTPTGRILGSPFDHFFYPGDTFSLNSQLAWIDDNLTTSTPAFVFLNIGETHVPYWHKGANWDPYPSPCVPFGSSSCSRRLSKKRQRACLEWVDQQLGALIDRFIHHTIIVCADHGDCWGEDGLWEHGISHWATLTVPLLMRLNGRPITRTST